MAPSSTASSSSQTASTSSFSSGEREKRGELGGLFRRTRPFVAVFHESANAYSSRKLKIGTDDTSIRVLHSKEEETFNGIGSGNGKGGKKPPKIFTNIKKSLANVKRWPTPSPTSATSSDITSTLLIGQNNTRVLYSTPAERLGAQPRTRTTSEIPLRNRNYGVNNTDPPTIAQIAMGLHSSRTPHSRSIRQPLSTQPQYTRRHGHSHSHPLNHNHGHGHSTIAAKTGQPTRSALKSSTTTFTTRENDNENDEEFYGGSRLFSTPSNLSSHTTLSMPVSIQNSTSSSDWSGGGNKMLGALFGKKRGRTIGRTTSLTTSEKSSASRKTVRFDDSSST